MIKAFKVPITKIDEEQRLVYGVATVEELDACNEIFDYASSKPYIEKWSQNYVEKTKGQSKGNVRAMHKSVGAGKLVDLTFEDAAKAITVAAKIVDDQEWQKCLEGVYTGFSFGGKSIGKKWPDPALGGLRYTLDPNELSLADAPCVRSAVFYDVVKTDGTIEQRPFKVAALKGGDNTLKGLFLVGKDRVAKGMYGVGQLASLLAQLQYLQNDAAEEAKWEMDNSPIPAELAGAIKALAEVLVKYVGEEASELVASMEVELKTLAAHDIQKAGARNNKSDAQKIQTVHDHSVDLGATCSAEKCAGSGGLDIMKLDEEGLKQVEEIVAKAIEGLAPAVEKTEQADDIQKINAVVEDQKKTIETLQAELDTVKKTVAPAKAVAGAVATLAVTKEVDAGGEEKPDVKKTASTLMEKIIAGGAEIGAYQ